MQGQHILTGDNDRLVKLFSAETTDLLRTFEGHTDLVRTVAVDLNLGVIVSGSYDRTVRMWDMRTGQCLKRVINGDLSLVFGVAMKAGRVIS